MSCRQFAPMTAVAAKATGANAEAVSPRKPSPPCPSGCVGISFRLRRDNLNAKNVHSNQFQSAKPSRNWNMDALTRMVYLPAAVSCKSGGVPLASHGVASTKPLYDMTL